MKWIAKLWNGERTFTKSWDGDYEDFMDWIDNHALEVVDIGQVRI